MYANGMGFRAIERVKQVHHTQAHRDAEALDTIVPSLPEILFATTSCLIHTRFSNAQLMIESLSTGGLQQFSNVWPCWNQAPRIERKQVAVIVTLDSR